MYNVIVNQESPSYKATPSCNDKLTLQEFGFSLGGQFSNILLYEGI